MSEPTATSAPTPVRPGSQAHSHGAGVVPEASRAERFASFDVNAFPVPTGREEDWRFTPVDRLRGLHDGTATPGGKVLIEVDGPESVMVENVPRDDPRLGTTGVPGDRVAAQAWCSSETATVLTLPTDTDSGATTVRLHGEGSDAAAYGHLLVDAKAYAKGTVVLDYRGSATYADNVEVAAGDGSQVTLVSIHDWEDDAVHLTQHHIKVGRDARVKTVVVNIGGSVVRICPSASFGGPGGDIELVGLYFADAGQHLEHRLFVDHAVPHCRSNVTYKGALQGDEAHTVWVGDVLIRAAAEGTDTYELNRNLVLTDGARADSVPNLEIETGEIIGAGHASATGRFDDEQLFYLQSRGIHEDEARRLVVRGFFAELLQRIGLPEVQDRLLATIDAELARAEGSGAATSGASRALA